MDSIFTNNITQLLVTACEKYGGDATHNLAFSLDVCNLDTVVLELAEKAQYLISKKENITNITKTPLEFLREDILKSCHVTLMGLTTETAKNIQTIKFEKFETKNMYLTFTRMYFINQSHLSTEQRLVVVCVELPDIFKELTESLSLDGKLYTIRAIDQTEKKDGKHQDYVPHIFLYHQELLPVYKYLLENKMVKITGIFVKQLGKNGSKIIDYKF